MKRSAAIFPRLERYNKNKYPTFIKKFLIEAGYDTAAALKTFDKSSIEEIEKFIGENPELVKNSIYVDEKGNLKTIPFKLKIGHESLLLSIPKDLKDYLSKKELEKKEEKGIPAIDELRNSLIRKLEQYCSKKKINATLDIELLSNFSTINNQVKCLIKCLFCNTKYTCTFDTCWRISNYYNHIREHNNLCAQKTVHLEIERAAPGSVLSEVENVLQ